MPNVFDHYGIARELLESGYHYDHLYANNNKATEAAINNAISQIVPQNGGPQLIRIGCSGDGGYLVPDDLTGIEACFSPGVNNFKDFEDHLTKRYGIKAFMCDYTSDVEKLRTPLIHGRQQFEKKWLEVTAGETHNDINDWVQINSVPDSDLILQMDIEGAEYRNLLHATTKTLSRFRILVIEFHGLQHLGALAFLSGIFIPALGKITPLFTCVHAHANNYGGFTQFGKDLAIPHVIELTFLRNDRIKKTTDLLTLPHPLDAPNTNARPPLLLEGIWLDNADVLLSSISALKSKVEWLEASSKQIGHLKTALDSCAAHIAHLQKKLLRNANNVAKGKLATQSSLSEYSTSEGANGAINGVKTGGFGFHTRLENNPWWMVDLGAAFDLSEILIFNRLDMSSERVKTLRVLVSLDSKDWILVYDHKGRPPFGGVKPLNGMPPLLIGLSEVRARYIKLQCFGKTCLHLDEVEIYKSEAAAVT